MPSSATANERDPAIDFLLRRIDYERVTTSPYGQREFKLERMRALLEAADNPHARYPIVHVAGTKGKGSTAAMLASILTATGRRTGLFSSPHLWRVEERIAIDRRPCDSQEFAKLLRRLQPVVAALDQQAAAESPPESGPTYFEILTAAALLHFAEQKVDMAVLEVGLGGRLDSTNVCSPEVAIITNISFDHMKQLGHTLSLIAAEKAGIIKSGIPVVSGVVDPEPREVIRRIAAERGAPLCELSRDFNFDYLPPPVTGAVDRASECRRAHFNFFSTSPRQRENDATDHDDAARLDERRQLPLPLLGRHQAANAAIATVEDPYYQALAARAYAEIGPAEKKAALERLVALMQELEAWQDINAAGRLESARTALGSLTGRYFLTHRDARAWLAQQKP